MKQSLQLKLGQQLTMTPQLQQAIRLLQLSSLDLQQEIQQALDSNPMLEVQDSDNETQAGDSDNDAHSTGDNRAGDDGSGDSGAEEGTWNEDVPRDLPVDTQWEDLIPSSAPPTPAGGGTGTESDWESRNTSAETLHDTLMWQLNLTRFSDTDRTIALTLLDAVDDNGRLTQDIGEIHAALADDLDIDEDEVVAVLHRLQQFEPAGVCARDLQECLLIQLRQLPEDTPWRREAELVLTRHNQRLASGDYKTICRRARLTEDQLKSVLALLQTLNPNPGQSVGDSRTEYIIPDVFVSKRDGRWVVTLNPDIAPRLRINETYAGLIRRADSSSDNTYLRDNLQEARWFLKSLVSRNETLMRVATEIVEHQRGFFEHGPEAMKPLVLHDIAEAVGMHESTISRVTTQKYMHTPRGVFELKYFFSSHVSTAVGGECSSTAIRAFIKKLVAAENPRKPLSDNKIAALLGEQGIKVARRTVAKYRDILLIPPSNERKRLV